MVAAQKIVEAIKNLADSKETEKKEIETNQQNIIIQNIFGIFDCNMQNPAKLTTFRR